MLDANPQEEKTGKPSVKRNAQTTGGVSFIPQRRETPEGAEPTREEMGRELSRAGIVGSGGEEYSVENAKRGGLVRPLRTYKDDIAEVLKGTGTSRISIKLAEEEREKRRRMKDRELLKSAQEGKREHGRLQGEELRLKEQEEQRQAQQAVKTERGPAEFSEKRIQAERERIRQEQRRLAQAQQMMHEEALAQRPLIIAKEKERAHRIKMFIASIGLVILGAGALYAAYTIFFVEEIRPPLLDIDTLVFAEENQDLVVGTLENRELVEKLTQEKNSVSVPSETVVNFNTLLTEVESPTSRDRLPASRLLEELAPRAPVSLARSVGPDYMLGIYTLPEKRGVFLILKPTFYENVFADMLSWELYMAEDLSPLFTTFSPALTPTGLGEETRNTSLSPFEDKIIENKDTRVLFDERGEIVLLYSFVDRDTLIIASNRDTFLEVFERMTAKRVTR